VLSESFDKSPLASAHKEKQAAHVPEALAKKYEKIGYKEDRESGDDPFLTAFVNLKLAACGIAMSKMQVSAAEAPKPQFATLIPHCDAWSARQAQS